MKLKDREPELYKNLDPSLRTLFIRESGKHHYAQVVMINLSCTVYWNRNANGSQGLIGIRSYI